MRRLLCLAVVVSTAACTATTPGNRNKAERTVLDALTELERQPFRFTYADLDDDTVVRGEVQDDLRYRATFLDNSNEVAKEIVVADDALAVRVPAYPALVPDADRLAATDSNLAANLAAGRWVIDYSAAPPLSAPVTREGVIEVGQDPLLDAAYVLQYVRRSIGDASTVVQFNPDAVEYNKRDDPFRKPLRSAGEIRYDITPPNLPRRSQRGATTAQLTASMFRQMAFYIKGRRLLEVVEELNPERNREFRRARQRGGPKFTLDLLEQVRRGDTREPIRRRRVALRITDVGKSVDVQLPLENAVAAPLDALVGARTGPLGGAPSPSPGPGSP